MRRLAFALLLVSTFGTLASAQTVIVTHAPAGGTVEVVFNTGRVATATADADGQATLTFALPGIETEADVHVSTERCGDVRRVLLVERGLEGLPPSGPCDRRDFPDVFVVQKITTFVVDFANPLPAVHLRQGPAPPSWLSDQASTSRFNLPDAPKGLIIGGGFGFSSAANWSDTVCGTNTATCTTSAATKLLTASVAYWFAPVFGVEATYLHPGDDSASGSGTSGINNFTFTSARKTQVGLLGGVAGIPLGGIRVVFRGGATYHEATMTTAETVASLGSQNFELKTAGWGWYGGGGVEIWLKSFLALYAEGGFVVLRGSALGNAEGSMDDHLITGTGGVRLHLWR